MDPEVHIARSFEEARAWEIEQERQMTPQERQAAAKVLRDRVFGPNPPDVRESTITDESRTLLP